MKNKVLITLSIVLAAVLGVQGYYLYKMSNRIQTLEVNQAASVAGTSGNLLKLPADPLSSGRWNPNTWNPYDEMRQMQDHINHLFGDIFTHFQGSKQFSDLFSNSLATPLLDMKDNGDQYVFKVNIPGADASKINVSIDHNRILHIDATTKSSEKKQNGFAGNILRRERFTGEFQRTVTLPEPVDTASLRSDYKDGVLTVTVKKRHSVS